MKWNFTFNLLSFLLGYYVDAGLRVTSGVLGFVFRVQSSQYNPEYLHKRIDEFIRGIIKNAQKFNISYVLFCGWNNICVEFEQTILSLSEIKYQEQRQSLVENNLEKPNCLYEEFDRYW